MATVAAEPQAPRISTPGREAGMVAHQEPVRTLVIGCGNPLRGDDAVGPVLVRRLWERGLPPGVHCVDGGTAGMDVAFQMRGVDEVILVDACRSGSEPGSLFEVPGEEVEHLPPLSGINLHSVRWDHAIAYGRWLLGNEYPRQVTACLVEAAAFEPGAPLSPAVDRAVDALADHLLGTFRMRRPLISQSSPPVLQLAVAHPVENCVVVRERET